MSVIRASDGIGVQGFGYGSTNARLIDYDPLGTGRNTFYASVGGTVLAEYTEYASLVFTWTKSYTYLGDTQLATITPNGTSEGNVEYNHPDRLGTRLVTNQAGGTSFEQAHLPFGKALESESSGASNKRFTSYDRSAPTGLDYAINRTYDSKQGRFTQVDPIGMQAASLANPQTLNMYTYCGNDPVNYTDPSGLLWNWLRRFFGWIVNTIRTSRIARRIAVRFVVSLVVSRGNFGVAIRSVIPDILGALGLAPPRFAVTPAWNPDLPYPVVFGGISSLSKYIILNFLGNDITKEPAVLKAFYCLLMAARWLLDRNDKTERAAWIVKKDDGTYEAVRWPWSAEANRETWDGPIPKGAVAIAHTHPPTASPRPSSSGGNTGRGDHGAADQVKLPVYVITRLAIWKAIPEVKKPESVVDGDWWKKFRKEKTKCD